MKKRAGVIVTFVICLLMITFIQPKAYAANKIALTGSKTVRAGETLTLSFSMNGNGILGFTAELEYDDALLNLSTVTKSVTGNWLIERNEKNIIAYDNDQKNPINKNVTVFVMTFTVNKTAETGKELAVKIKNVTASDGNEDIVFGEALYSVKISAPKSSNADIADLKLSNASLTKTFDKNVTEYDLTVPFSVTALDMSVTVADKNATYKIDGNKNFAVGKNTVKIIVTAENGTQKTYTVNVKREQDPNYKPSNNSLLSQIILSEGKVSPTFSPNVKDYIVYLQYETEKIVVSGKTADQNATVKSTEYSLKAGNNKVTLICTAEDGVTATEYLLNIYRMPKYEGKLPNITTDTPNQTITPNPTATPSLQPEPSKDAYPIPTPTISTAPEPSATTSSDPTPGNIKKNFDISILKIVAVFLIAVAVAGMLIAIKVYIDGAKSNSRKK